MLNFEQVNTSWVLRASNTQRHISKVGDVKIFNGLDSLKLFTENRKTCRNLVKPVSISKLTPVRFISSVKNSLITFSITLLTFIIVFYRLEQPLKVILENSWINSILLQINFSDIFEAFARVLKDDYSEQLLITGFVIILLKRKTHRNI